MADVKFDLSRSNIMIAEKQNIDAINKVFDSMKDEGMEMLIREGITEERRSYQRFIDARYEFQNYEISIELPDCLMTEEVLAQAIEDFHKEHEKNYGYYNKKNRVQIVNYRISAIGDIDKPELKELPCNPNAKLPLPIEKRKVLFQGEAEFIETNIYKREELVPGCTFTGPVILEQMDSTIVVPPDWIAKTDGFYNLVLTYNGGEKVMSQKAKKKVDAVTVEIIGNLLLSIAEEVTTVIIKSAYSTNIKERRDVSTGIVDPDGNMVAQAENLAIHLGSLLTFVKELYKKHPKETIRPGDMFIGNDPYNGGGNHLPDIVIAAPAFEGDTMIGWVVNMAHHSDIGGKIPGSTSGDAVSIFQEGLKLPIVRICKNDKVLDNVMDLILANTRVPKERYGDLIAQISANRVGVHRLKDAFKRYDVMLLDCMDELQNYAERRLRAVIRNLKDGVYKFTDYMDNAGEKYPDPLPISVTITIKDDFIDFDFTVLVIRWKHRLMFHITHCWLQYFTH